MPVNSSDVDEVWLALEQAFMSMARDGHKPSYDQLSCYQCYAMQLLRRGMEVYTTRRMIDFSSDRVS